nr:Chain C, Jagged 1 N-box peptide [Homo sapiens]
NQIKNPIEKHG